MYELAMMMYLAREVRIVLLGRLQYYLQPDALVSAHVTTARRKGWDVTYLGAICELMGREIYLAKGTLSNQAA